MNHKKSLIILIMCLALPLVGQAQSAHWALTPTYQSITRFSPTLFKVKTAMSSGICDMEEKWVVSPSMDSITNITNGFALAMTKSKDKYRIVYIIKENGTREAVKEELYAGEYSYFTEDRCPVENKKGKYGYMDPSGKLAVACTYTAALPFKNGTAYVSKEKGGFAGLWNKVTKKGKSNVFQVDKNGKSVAADVNFEVVKSQTMIKQGEPYTEAPDASYQRFSNDKLYGYRKGNSILLPAQFEEAGRVVDDCAIVMVDHQFGVVKFNSATIECKVSESKGTLKAEATIPSVWENKIATITRIVNDASQKEFEMEGTGTERKLEVDVSNEKGTKVYELACEKLILWRSKNRIDPGPGPTPTSGGISVSAPSTVQANKQNVCSVTITVTNRGSSARNISISLSTGQKSSIKLGAGKSGSVTVKVPVTKNTKCTITASGGGVSSSCSTNLIAKVII